MKTYRIYFEGSQFVGNMVATSEMEALNKYAVRNSIKERSTFVMTNKKTMFVSLVSRCGTYTAVEV